VDVSDELNREYDAGQVNFKLLQLVSWTASENGPPP